MRQAIKPDGNLKGTETNMPVRMFVSAYGSVEKKIGGLLDYGYDEQQVANMLGIPIRQVKNIMHARGYVTLDRLAK